MFCDSRSSCAAKTRRQVSSSLPASARNPGGSHLYKACYALDNAWSTHVPQNATLVRNIAQACETLQSIPRYFYALSPSTW